MKEVEVTIPDIEAVEIEELVTLLMNGRQVDREFMKKLIRTHSEAIKQKLEPLYTASNGSKEGERTFKDIMKCLEIVLEGSEDLRPYTERYQELKQKDAAEKAKKEKEEFIAGLEFGCARLEDASGTLKADKEVVLAAVARNGNALQYASAELKDELEVVLVAV